MVVGAFPIVKLGGLLVRQISRPIANSIKEKAKSSMFFRTYVCMPPAQFYNWCEIKAKMWILNLGKPVNIPVLSEAMAIELGANLLGEGVVFVIAAGLLIAEYSRSANKETAKEAARVEEVNDLLCHLQDLYFKVEQQETRIRELTRMVVSLENSSFTRIFKKGVTETLIEPTLEETKQQTQKLENKNKLHKTTYNIENVNLVIRAAGAIQEEITGNIEDFREEGIVNEALFHIQNNVYRRGVAVK